MESERENINFLKCGIFKTSSKYQKRHTSRKRILTNFEVEFFLDYQGKTLIDNRECMLSPQSVFLGKPGETRSGNADFKCYYVHFEIAPQTKYYSLLMELPNSYQFINAKKYFALFDSLIFHYRIKEFRILFMQNSWNCSII